MALFRTFPAQTYINRRLALMQQCSSGLILLLGNDESPMNFKDNTYKFRQDSSFLYYFGLDVAGLAAILDVESGEQIIFGTELTIDDIIWTGPLPSIESMAESIGIYKTLPFDQIATYISKYLSSHKVLHFLPPYRADNLLKLSKWLSVEIEHVGQLASEVLIKAIVKQRSYKEACEIEEIHRAASITADMHLAALHFTKPGMKEYEIVAQVEAAARRTGGTTSFASILTVRGETLHNHYHGNTVKEGQMILCDAGAETDMHYAGDMTCTFPVGKAFTPRQKEVYEIVLQTHKRAVAMLKPGIAYKDIYLASSVFMFEQLGLLGLTKGNAEEAVAAGAHAMFFQCGLGHMMGLDVHDMEDLGEKYVGYSDQIVKSTQFGMKSLRLGKTLETGFVLTVEPGIYFIPSLIDLWKSKSMFQEFIHYNKLETYKDFGGIRIEEDYVIQDDGKKLLGKALPMSVIEIENIRRSALE